VKVYNDFGTHKISVQPDTLDEDEFIRWNQEDLRENLNKIIDNCMNIQTMEYVVKQMQDFLDLEFQKWKGNVDIFEDLRDIIDEELKI